MTNIQETDEQKLEELSIVVERFAEHKSAPVYEVFLTLFSLTSAVFLFLFANDMEGIHEGYHPMLYAALESLLTPWIWAFVFLLSGSIKAIGLIFQKDRLRILGLLLSAFIYMTISSTLIMWFPNLVSILFTYMAVFAFYCIGSVKYTGIRT